MNEINNDYYTNINNFEYSKDIANFLGKISIVASLILIGNIYYIKLTFEKRENPKNFFSILSFIICSILFIIELFIFSIFLYLFLRIFEIINFLDNNIKNQCIILSSWNYDEKVLKHLMKMIMVLGLLKIFHFQLLIYLLKQLIVMNNFFYYEEDLNMSSLTIN